MKNKFNNFSLRERYIYIYIHPDFRIERPDITVSSFSSVHCSYAAEITFCDSVRIRDKMREKKRSVKNIGDNIRALIIIKRH